MMKKISILNGVNLNMLGQREAHIYGTETFEDIFLSLKKKFTDVELNYFQSNSEAECIAFLHKEGARVDAILFNPGAFTHQSYALADAISSISCPVLEIHISHTYAREEFRKKSFLSSKCIGSIIGLGLKGYELGIRYFLDNG